MIRNKKKNKNQNRGTYNNEVKTAKLKITKRKFSKKIITKFQ